jgi:plasmid stabilization system protein ParE
MEYSVELAPQVDRDLDEIYAYLTENASPTVALRITDRIYDRITGLKFYPHSCPTAPESKATTLEVRNALVGVYRVLFYVHDQQVHVVHVRHGRRDKIRKQDLQAMITEADDQGITD